MKTFLLAIAFALLPCLASAATFKLPDGAPAVSVTIPDNWSPKAVDNGVEATSDDSSIYVAVEVTEPKDTEELIKQDIKFLADQKVTLDEKSLKKTEGEVNGMKGVDVSWDGTDKDGPTKISLTIIVTKGGKIVLLTYWGNKEGEAKNKEALGGILQSLQSL